MKKILIAIAFAVASMPMMFAAPAGQANAPAKTTTKTTKAKKHVKKSAKKTAKKHAAK
jgi:hypothetical protein